MIEDNISIACPLHNGNVALTFLDDMRVLLHHILVFVLLEKRLEVVERLHGSTCYDGEPTLIDYLGEFSTFKTEDLNSYSFGILPLKQ